MSSKIFTTVVSILIVGTFSFIGYNDAVRIWQDLQQQEEHVQQLNVEYEKLDNEFEKTTEKKEQSQQEVQKLEKEKQDLETERQRLEKELQTKAETKARLARASQRVINTATATQTASAAPIPARQGSCGDNQYAAYIYGMESGGRVVGNCSTTARNPGGCYGIGQACPASKVAQCGTNYSCQNAWFSSYAIDRYGSWASAYSFHKANGWW